MLGAYGTAQGIGDVLGLSMSRNSQIPRSERLLLEAAKEKKSEEFWQLANAKLQNELGINKPSALIGAAITNALGGGAAAGGIGSAIGLRRANAGTSFGAIGNMTSTGMAGLGGLSAAESI